MFKARIRSWFTSNRNGTASQPFPAGSALARARERVSSVETAYSRKGCSSFQSANSSVRASSSYMQGLQVVDQKVSTSGFSPSRRERMEMVLPDASCTRTFGRDWPLSSAETTVAHKAMTSVRNLFIILPIEGQEMSRPLRKRRCPHRILRNCRKR